ncbi:MAG: hypothetical protein HUJ80_07490 [Firmicutes bacterium]|nr:hypothetical protein [Bacillota bacterium]
MDWSRAKYIIIAALVAANLFLGYMYVSQQTGEKARRQAAAEDTVRYMEYLGVELLCPLPSSAEKLPVVFVTMEKESGEPYETKDGYPIVVTGQDGYLAKPDSVGENRGSVLTASDALHRLIAELPADRLQGLSVSSIRLLYLVDRTGLAADQKQDTAVPSWQVVTDRGIFYENAFAQ